MRYAEPASMRRLLGRKVVALTTPNPIALRSAAVLQWRGPACRTQRSWSYEVAAVHRDDHRSRWIGGRDGRAGGWGRARQGCRWEQSASIRAAGCAEAAWGDASRCL